MRKLEEKKENTDKKSKEVPTALEEWKSKKKEQARDKARKRRMERELKQKEEEEKLQKQEEAAMVNK